MNPSLAIQFRAGILAVVLATTPGLVNPGSAKDLAGRDLGAIWSGGYTYTYDGGRTAGGSAILVEYRLGIAADPKGKACRLDIEGFQTNQTLLCRLSGSESDATVRFESYGDGSTVNAHGVKEYEVGEGLIALRRTSDGRIVTDWLKISPDDTDKFEQPGVFFLRKR